MRLGVQLNMCVPECFNDSALQDLSVAEDDDEGVRRHCPPQGFARGGTARKKLAKLHLWNSTTGDCPPGPALAVLNPIR